ncbi:hypothetical protein BUALT_Bualt15G0028100 [Buddleja alternifolia]|uniref:Cytochrome P450 n=1 Tax=Buddleja alternifolia TaxID=168488 RepID=A0AAV6WMW8_9LAMI|nr:hypothetical protein BUALT_Bualt15G0028100 [Buddleja alternifolia]
MSTLYREANKPADMLAKRGYSTNLTTLFLPMNKLWMAKMGCVASRFQEEEKFVTIGRRRSVLSSPPICSVFVAVLSSPPFCLAEDFWSERQNKRAKAAFVFDVKPEDMIKNLKPFGGGIKQCADLKTQIINLEMLSYEIYVVALITIFLSRWIYRWRNPKCKGILPPGSSGLPLIGESLQLLIPSYSFDVHPFLKKRLQKYGKMFRTNVAGHNMIVSADQEFNLYLFQQEEKLVVHWYLDLFAKLFQQEGKLMPDGLSIHKYMRNLTLNHFGVESIKQKLLNEYEQLVHKTFHSWSMRESVEVKYASVEMYGEYGANLLYSFEPERAKGLIDKFINVSRSAMSFPLNIPGTTYHKCLKDKEEVLKTMKGLVKERISSPQNNTQDDLLGRMIKDMKNVDFLTEGFITQLLFGLSFVAFESIPPMLALAVKFITENPDVLRELTAEHEEILKKRENVDSLITWEEYKSMKFTLQVINETLRLGNTIPGFLRKAVKDINVNGYTIPEGWGIMVCHSVTHLDPNTYEDPLTFNPWRWKDVKPEFISKNLKPFGGGIKQCAGADYARASMSVFLHILVTKYRWTVVKGGDIIQSPVMRLKNGLHIKLSEKRN